MKIVDLRSDTVTKPSKEMLDFALESRLGDDVYGEDPTVNKLEKTISKMLKKEAAVLVPSGTQSNLIALLTHCERGDEYIVGQQAHTYKYEAGGAAVLGSIQPQPVDFEHDATIDLKKVYKYIKPDDYHFATTKLICLENTHIGKVLPLNYLKKFKKFCALNNLSSHLDGARFFNAIRYLKANPSDVSSCFDSVSICLSKGLGAPIGSLLLGSEKFISRARKWRKMLGGGMRQAGIVAAYGLFALKNNIKRLDEDHKKALIISEQLKKIEGINVIGNTSFTNMIFVSLKKNISHDFIKYLNSHKVILGGYDKYYDTLRIVTHLDITYDDIEKFTKLTKLFFKKLS